MPAHQQPWRGKRRAKQRPRERGANHTEPISGGRRPNHMTADSLRADLPGIHALGGAFDAHAADLSAVAAALRSMPSPADALGPIGERFVAAFAASVSAHIDAVAALSTRASAGAVSAGATAAGYDAAGQRAAALLPRV